MKARNLIASDISYDDIRLGDTFSFAKKITSTMIRTFAALTDDYSPLHTDEAYARETEFGGRVAHGMLLGGLFSTLVGMLCPGKRALYLSQTLRFRSPLKPETTVFVYGTVMHKSDAAHVIELKTSIKDRKGVIYVDGVARVKVRDR